ncbi:MAG: SCO family protein [Pseudomonadota bacterium]|nr:SCO family protein [Pseudomonadota bacterium]
MLCFGLAGCDRTDTAAHPAAPAFKGADVTGAEYGRTLALPDIDGQPRTLGDFKGKVTVVFFGYTQCPDVCPATMAELAQVKKSLGPQGDRLQGVFVTIDPERDTPAILKSYMASFDPTFVALRGSAAQTEAAAKEFKVYYAKVPGQTEGSYTMDHTAGAYVLDPKGNLRLFERYGAGADALADDVKALIAQG